MSIEKYISPFIQSHFPEFYKEYGSNFIAFTRAYYEWLESAGNPLEQSRSIYEYADIDSTLDTFVKYFKNKYMFSIPENIEPVDVPLDPALAIGKRFVTLATQATDK